MDSLLLSPTDWADYELIDCGGFEKLERFGDHVTIRPEPQALWPRSMPEGEWERLADAVFRRSEEKGGSRYSEERGQWTLRKGVAEQWRIGYRCGDASIRMRLGFTAFKHVGVFPEQAENWKFIYDRIAAMKEAGGERPRILNLFAYTGGATLVARVAGADVTHVDSVKQVVGWARENMEESGLDGVRWIVDDAMKFVQREVRRGNLYHGIILDPPSYGRGPGGEKWVLEQHIGGMLDACSRLLAPGGFLVLNLYSMGLSALLARTAVREAFGLCGERPEGAATKPQRTATERYGELYFDDRFGKSLPLGVFYRFFDTTDPSVAG